MFEGIATHEQRKKRAKEIYDKFIFADRLSMSSVSDTSVSYSIQLVTSDIFMMHNISWHAML